VDEEGCVADLVGCVGMGSGRLVGSDAGSDCVLKVAAGRGVGVGRGVEAFLQCRRSSSLWNGVRTDKPIDNGQMLGKVALPDFGQGY
jgi:hypothetical protein